MKDEFLRQLKNILSFIDVKRSRQRKAPTNCILFPVIWVTNRCNLRCKMCDQWKTDPAILSQELTTREWFSFIDSASRMHAAVIIITGGEPLLRGDIFDILEYIRKKGIASHLCTNGTLLNEVTVNRLKDSKLSSISISLDSEFAEIHNEMREVDCFDTVVKGIKLLRRTMSKANIGINFLITKRNFRNIDGMVSFAENLGVNQIKFAPIHTNLQHRHKDFSNLGYFLFTQDDLSQLRHEIDKLISAASQTKLLTTSLSFMEGIPNLYDTQYVRLPCYAGYISCAVDALGWVSPCEDIDGDENLRNKSLEEIWKSSSFQQLREQAHNCTSKCWDTTHTELNIRCSGWGFMEQFSQIRKEMNFYFSVKQSIGTARVAK